MTVNLRLVSAYLPFAEILQWHLLRQYCSIFRSDLGDEGQPWFLLSSSDLGKLCQGKPHTSWQIAVAFCCMLPLTPEEICAKDVWVEHQDASKCLCKSGHRLWPRTVQLWSATQPHWSCGMHALEADLAKRPWLGRFVAKQWVLSHCEARR